MKEIQKRKERKKYRNEGKKEKGRKELRKKRKAKGRIDKLCRYVIKK